jgi:hypothetical protein
MFVTGDFQIESDGSITLYLAAWSFHDSNLIALP